MFQLPILADDDLCTPEVGDWAEQKYRLVRVYADLFAASMKGKWKRVFVDLYAAAGRALLRNRRVIVPSSAMLALTIPRPFDRYVFCDLDEERLSALQKRVEREAPGLDVRFVKGDVNADIDRVLAEIPNSPDVLTLCFADPYRLRNLRFDTIRRLCAPDRRTDLLTLIPSGFDANRNFQLYLDDGSDALDNFLGSSEWKAAWEERRQTAVVSATTFVAEYFARQMGELGYLQPGHMPMIHSSEKNLRLYHLALFSRHPLGGKFWKEAQKYTDPNRSLFE